MNEKSLESLLKGRQELSDAQIRKILSYYHLLLEESRIQNLTRLIQPQEFYDGHLLDVLEFQKIIPFGLKTDIGSGAGIPGLICALLREDPWQLWEAELRKADFLRKCVDTLALGSQVEVIHSRVENDSVKKDSRPEIRTFTFRAVGKIEKVYKWIRSSFTWNEIVLFKGPSWEEEWAQFPYKKELQIEFLHHYEVGLEKKKRILVGLKRTQALPT